jgi:ribosome production factor 2
VLERGTHSFAHRKPKNARSKRALDAREPKEVEDPRTVVFVKGTHTGEVLNGVFKDLVRNKVYKG